MPPKAQPPQTMQEFAQELAALRRAVFNTPRLHRKDLAARYGKSERTLYRWIRRGWIPKPAIRFSGPLWREEDLQAAELSGRIPRPASA